MQALCLQLSILCLAFRIHYLGMDLILSVPASFCGPNPLWAPLEPSHLSTSHLLSPKISKLRVNVSPQFRGSDWKETLPWQEKLALKGCSPTVSVRDFVHQDFTKAPISQPPLALIQTM